MDGTSEDVPGHRNLEGTDLEVAYNLEGGDLVLRVNKGPVLIFRVRLAGVVRDMGDDELLLCNSVAPDFIFRMGENCKQMAKGLGLDDEQKSLSQPTVTTTRLDERLSSVDRWGETVAKDMKNLSKNEALRKKIARDQS